MTLPRPSYQIELSQALPELRSGRLRIDEPSEVAKFTRHSLN